jgi:2-hydroxy-6-oxonona-2,4-dienedioate hydrolase
MHALVREDLAPPCRLPVVLVHGAAVSSRHMAETAKALATHFPVYAPDFPGHGESENPPRVLDARGLAESTAAWIAATGITRAHLLGNSFGCQVIAELAVRHPDLVDRIVLQGPTVDPQAHGPPQIARWFVNSLREGMTQPNATFGQWAKAGPRVFVRTLLFMDRHRIERALPHVQAPTLIIRGSRDPIIPQRWAEEATRMLPDGRLEVIEGETHTIVLSAPQRLVRVVVPFLRETQPQQPGAPG